MSALDRMKARVQNLSTDEGSIMHDFLGPVAVEIDELTDYILPAALDAVMPDTAVGVDLDRVALVYGVDRKPSAYAQGSVQFTGTPGAAIAQGTPVTTASGQVYITTTPASIGTGGSVMVPVQANTPGSSYNVGAGAVNRLTLPIVGVTAATNLEAIGGGADTEPDEAMRARLMLRIKLPSASGTEADYERWAMEVPGVAAAKCTSVWAGPGTVKVVIAGAGMTAPDETTRQRCADYLETVRPVGALVTVTAAQALAVTVTATLVLSSGYSIPTVKPAVEASLTTLLKTIGMKSPRVSIAQVGATIMSVPGVTDYTGLTINGAAASLTLSAEQLPVLSGVTLA